MSIGKQQNKVGGSRRWQLAYQISGLNFNLRTTDVEEDNRR